MSTYFSPEAEGPPCRSVPSREHIYRQPIVAAGGGGLQVELDELEGDDLARLDGDGVDAGHVVVVEGALPVRKVDQAGRSIVRAPAL